MLIKEVKAKKILDSRNEPTIEVTVNSCSASSPAGKSTGKYETPSYFKSLENNIKLINNLKELKKLEITNFNDLWKVEHLIKNKFKLKDAKKFGANALFALESAILKALAKHDKKELWQIINPNARNFPIPVGNAIGGGMHSHNTNRPIFQEFLLIPKETSFSARVLEMQQTYSLLGRLLESKNKNDEGAWETELHDEQILELLSKFKDRINIGIDIASSGIFKEGGYHYNRIIFSREKQIEYINHLIKKYNIFYVEDPIEENDFNGFSKIIKQHLIVGDDLTVTHIDRLKKAVKSKSINAIIIKPNQNGSVLELRNIFYFCKKKGIKTIISHRSGETLDDSIADYAFGFQADLIKCGISTKWREVKLNRLIEIEKKLKRN